MDAFEPVRQAATELREQVVAAGADVSQSLSLVHGAVRALELKVAWLPSGDPALKGARGVFDERQAQSAALTKATKRRGRLSSLMKSGTRASTRHRRLALPKMSIHRGPPRLRPSGCSA